MAAHTLRLATSQLTTTCPSAERKGRGTVVSCKRTCNPSRGLRPRSGAYAYVMGCERRQPRSQASNMPRPRTGPMSCCSSKRRHFPAAWHAGDGTGSNTMSPRWANAITVPAGLTAEAFQLIWMVCTRDSR